MKLPQIHQKLEHLTMGDYEVFVATLEEKDFPQYVVINSTTKVIECNHNNLFYIKDWLKYAENELKGGIDSQQVDFPFATLKAN